MSGPFKTSLIAGLIGAVVLAVVTVVTGGRGIGAILGMALIGFAVVLLISYVIARLVSKRDDEDDYEYEDD